MESSVTTADATAGRLRDVICRTLELPPGTDCSALEFRTEPRWDSVMHLQLVLELEQEFDVTIDNEDVLGMTSFGSVLDVLRRQGL